MSDTKQKKPRGRPRKANTIFAKQESVAEPIIESVTEEKKPVNEIVQPSEQPPQPSPPQLPQLPQSVTEPIKIPIKVTKKGKKDHLEGKKVLTIIDEPVKLSVPEPVKLSVTEPVKLSVTEPVKLSVTESVPVKEPKGKKAPKAPKEPKPKAPPKPREPKPIKRDEELYRMVYTLQQSLQHQSRPKKKVAKYESSDTDSASSEVSEEDEPEEKYTKKIQKRLETIDNIQKRLQQAKQPTVKGKYDHLSIF